MAKYILLFIIFSSIVVQTMAKRCVFTKKYWVHVVNNLPPDSPPLHIHCASKNDELGHLTLTTNQDFSFEFCEGVFGTLFFCNMQWNGKDNDFDVFDSTWYENRCRHGVCYYSVKSDGIYLADTYPPKQFRLLLRW